MLQKKKQKKGRGRPALPEAQRLRTVTFRATLAELDRWCELANEERLPVRTWIRRVCNEAAR